MLAAPPREPLLVAAATIYDSAGQSGGVFQQLSARVSGKNWWEWSLSGRWPCCT